MIDQSNKNAPKVFISHATADKARFVLEFATRLRSNGVDAWVDQWEMNPGDSMVDKIFEEGLKDCQAIVVVLSEHSVQSKWVREELNAAVVRKIEKATRLIPVRLDRCEVPECLRATIWQDIPNLQEYGEPFSRILNAIYRQYEKPLLGPAPHYIHEATPLAADLAAIDLTLLLEMGRMVVAQGGSFDMSVDAGDLYNKAGLTKEAITESQDMLRVRGYIKDLIKYLDSPIFHCRLTDSGFGLIGPTVYPEYETAKGEIVRTLAMSVPRAKISAHSLSALLARPQFVMDHLLAVLQSEGMVSMRNYSEVGNFTVEWISPELRRRLGS
ncbi:MAG: toll/interleukin-1 receptor domain-containing protein [Bryobacteraceae bacterium]